MNREGLILFCPILLGVFWVMFPGVFGGFVIISMYMDITGHIMNGSSSLTGRHIPLPREDMTPLLVD